MKNIKLEKCFVETTIIGYVDIFYTICNCFTNTKQSICHHFNHKKIYKYTQYIKILNVIFCSIRKQQMSPNAINRNNIFFSFSSRKRIL